MKKIIFVEDDEDLRREAQTQLTAGGYIFQSADISQTMKLDYWKSVGITNEYLVALDLNLSKAGVSFNGIDAFRTLRRAKETGILPGLEYVLIQTSVKGEASPANANPEFVTNRLFRVYGQEKAQNPVTRVIESENYGANLKSMIDNIFKGEVKQLNERFYRR